jgi:Astacin (Peptidase family M12A)
MGDFPWYRYGVDYDLNSVMHYSATDASISGKPTMKPITGGHVGPGAEATANDYRKLCVLYRCGVCLGRPFNRTTNYCPYPWVPREVEGCEQTLERTDGDDFSGKCCQTREQLADSIVKAPASCDTCSPDPDCDGTWVIDSPARFNSSCCG